MGSKRRWKRFGTSTVTRVSYKTYVWRDLEHRSRPSCRPPWQPRAWLLLQLAASLIADAATADQHEVSGHHDDEIFHVVVQVGDVALHI